MEFRLTWKGVLLGASKTNTRAQHKHEIRKAFHHQLKRLWEFAPHLQSMPLDPSKPGRRVLGRPYPEQTRDSLAERFSRFGYRFVPLATESLDLFCSIEVLMLRPGSIGSLIQSGDIDGRLKTIFDALKVPNEVSQLGKYKKPADDEDPFYCLLEDDKLISKASVESDVLLEPVSEPPNRNDARVVISVRIRPAHMNTINFGFG